MRALLISLVSLFASVSFAQVEMNSADGSTVYNKVAALYQAGTLLDVNMIADKLASGRCFGPKEPNKPLPAALTASKYVDDVGPIQEPIANFSAFAILHLTGEAPSLYDSKNVKNLQSVRFPLIKTDDVTYTLTFPGKDVISVRYAHPYIVSTAVLHATNEAYACYFFIIR